MSSHWLRWGLINYLPGLALNKDLPDLCLRSSGITDLSHLSIILICIFFMLFAGKQMELEIIGLSDINQVQKDSSSSYTESRPKKII
jgi:hypothetical protein